ncbi:thioredoxin-like protein [Metschnikowia bicuspidata var. bicuspidata NRRL YB-4993]|uniref:Thioredoxin-like protein n=1 Tax=Metschnikowia bicuspidata var. bicuspidata NRRL YB-4993 TaxID=869754 RepID=A0A1A0HBX5_9ASCO|nr:thioredoxin-like protein [Metschnikowia bicuspidata var. bicuspidata NRRL YB-4993]OBA21639.1 thioredoxin-like protein [Metschnikowia bicuspidata var. bicuspidata NRRL YB-4993]
MDRQLTEYIEKYQEAKLHSLSARGQDQALDSDTESLLELLEELENEDGIVAKYKEQRLQQLQQNIRSIDRAADVLGEDVGCVNFIGAEKDLMGAVTRTEIAVVHFYQPTFSKCKTMNEKLAVLAEKHLALHVLAIPAEKASFLVSKLKIKVLPFVVVYRHGQEIARIVGFEGIGESEDAVTITALETRLIQCGAISRRTINTGTISRPAAVKKEDSDDDWF